LNAFTIIECIEAGSLLGIKDPYSAPRPTWKGKEPDVFTQK